MQGNSLKVTVAAAAAVIFPNVVYDCLGKHHYHTCVLPGVKFDYLRFALRDTVPNVDNKRTDK